LDFRGDASRFKIARGHHFNSVIFAGGTIDGFDNSASAALAKNLTNSVSVELSGDAEEEGITGFDGEHWEEMR
jgi:hypothetical protein